MPRGRARRRCAGRRPSSGRYRRPVSPVRRCSRTACGTRPSRRSPTSTPTRPPSLGPLATYAEPHSYDLCAAHAERLTAPRGWEVAAARAGSRRRSARRSDDLLALADAVREAGPAGARAEARSSRRSRSAAAGTCGCCATPRTESPPSAALTRPSGLRRRIAGLLKEHPWSAAARYTRSAIAATNGAHARRHAAEPREGPATCRSSSWSAASPRLPPTSPSAP